MRSGVVEANLLKLNEIFDLPYIPDLIARKLNGPEQSVLTDADFEHFGAEYVRLRSVFESAFESSELPESASGKALLNDLLIRLRMNFI